MQLRLAELELELEASRAALEAVRQERARASIQEANAADVSAAAFPGVSGMEEIEDIVCD